MPGLGSAIPLLADAPTAPAGGPMEAVVAEDIGVGDGAGLGNVFVDILQQTLRVAPTLVPGQGVVVTDIFSVIYGLSVFRAQLALAEDDIGISDDFVALYGVVVAETIALALAQSGTFKFNLTAADTVRTAGQLTVGVPVAITGGIGVALTQQAQLSLQVIERLGLLPAVGPLFKYGKSISETVRIASALGRFFGGDISESIGVLESMSGYAAKGGQVSEGIGLAPSLNPQLVLRVTAADDIGINDTAALRMIFDQNVAEDIEITAGYVAPDGNFTTWAVNTRSGAVTEYDNYAFNSFAQIGHKYLGASASGLYELVGDDDAGTDIIAQIKSGFAQWAGTKFTMFKAAYLGVRGGGDFVLKLTTGDDKTYNYAVSARDMRTTKVNIGKGIRTRYFAFELISTGQDFDLDTIEFVPLVVERRV